MTLGTLYVMVWGYLQLTGQIEEPFMTGLRRIILLVVVLGAALQLWLYNAVIVDTFYNAPGTAGGSRSRGHFAGYNTGCSVAGRAVPWPDSFYARGVFAEGGNRLLHCGCPRVDSSSASYVATRCFSLPYPRLRWRSCWHWVRCSSVCVCLTAAAGFSMPG